MRTKILSKRFCTAGIVVLLIVVGLFGIGVYSRSRPPEYNPFIERILENGGGVVVAIKTDAAKQDVATSEDYDGGHELKSKEYTRMDITNIKTLWTKNISVTEDDFRSLPPLKSLYELVFEQTTLRGSIFRYLECPCIDNLAFNNCRFESSIDELLGDQPVEGLTFVYIEFPDFFFKTKETKNRPTITSFSSVPSTNLSDEITSFFNECPNLQSVLIAISDLQCTFIRDMKYVEALETIDIDNTNLNDEVFSSILRFNKLQFVAIANCKVTEKSIPVLEELAKRAYFVHLTYQDEIIFYTIDGKSQL